MTGYGCPPGKRRLEDSFMHAQAGEMLMVRHVGHDLSPTEGGGFLVRFPMTFLAMVSCPLSQREREREAPPEHA
jgi:hypothetical protein